MKYLAALFRSILASLRPGGAPWALGPAAWATVTAALIAGAGVVTGKLTVIGLVFLGAACAVSFLATGFHRAKWWAVAAQAVGGALGITAGAILMPDSVAGLLLTAAAAGVISGMVGGIGPSATAFGMMLSVGVAFGQFGKSPLPWWQQGLWYLSGTAVAAVGVLAPWVIERGAAERRALAGVLFAAADLCAVIGTDQAGPARARLAAASATARPVGDRLRADLVAFAVAALYARGHAVPEPVSEAIRRAGDQIRCGEPITVTFDGIVDPALKGLADALSPRPTRPGAPLPAARELSALVRATTSRTALVDGARIGLCMAVATGIALVLPSHSHSFWLPLTTAVIVRPEYASVFVRTVNRTVGTLIGALLAAGLLAVCSSGWQVAAAAALALGFVVLSAPKLYGLSVIGITIAALLSQSISHADPTSPGIRLTDTLAGAAVAVVFGYLLWPSARRLPESARLSSALAAARDYLAEAVKPPDERRHWQSARDDAYRLAHQLRASAEAAMLEPPPVSSYAARALPAAIEVEEIVDTITAVSAAADAGCESRKLSDDVRRRLAQLDRSELPTTGK